jgi:translation initiation factor 1
MEEPKITETVAPTIAPTLIPTIPTFSPQLIDTEPIKKNFEKVHLHVKQRNTKKFITSIEGLEPYLEESKIPLKDLMKSLKKKLSCNGNISKSEEAGNIIQFQGDHRKILVDYLIKNKIVDKNNITIHGS